MTAPTIGRSTHVQQRRIDMALPVVLELIDAVRCFDRPRVAYLAEIVDQPTALVLLAGMVPQGYSPRRLLAWSDTPPKQRRPRRQTPSSLDVPDDVREAHRIFNAQKVAGVTPPDEVRDGEREYQRLRAQQRRARAAAAAAIAVTA